MQELGVVHRTITRAADVDVKALSEFGVSTIHEAMGRLGLMRPVHPARLPRRQTVRHRRHGAAAAR